MHVQTILYGFNKIQHFEGTRGSGKGDLSAYVFTVYVCVQPMYVCTVHMYMYAHVCMYICLYHVCMYVCMYV